MYSSPKVSYPLSLILLLFFSCFGHSLSDHNNLVYRHCANHTFTDPPEGGSLPQILSSLFQELLVQSSQSKFYETSVGDEKIAISGLFQCRNDLSTDDCYSCVKRLPEMTKSFCGISVPARIHLSGCYIHYKADGSEVSRLELQHKTCSESKADSVGFEELRDGAFAALESGVVSGNGFCETSYESMHVTAQCEGDLEACDCGECVNSAVHIAQDECGYSLSGEVYLDSCFISYNNYENGIPGNSNPDYGTGNNSNNASGKLVAIVVGGAAALAIGFMFSYFYRSWRRKTDDF